MSCWLFSMVCFWDRHTRAAVAWPSRNTAFLRRHRGEALGLKLCWRLSWWLALLKVWWNLLCEEVLAWKEFLMHPYLRITAKSDGVCILSSANSRYSRGTDGWLDICWTEFQEPQLQLSKDLSGSTTERGGHPVYSERTAVCQLQNLSWEVLTQLLNLCPAAFQRCCPFHWPHLGIEAEHTLRALPLRNT